MQDKFVYDSESEARFTVGGAFLAKDKTQVTDGQIGVLLGTASFEKGADWFLKARGVFPSAGQAPRDGQVPGGSPSSSEMKGFEEYFTRMNDAQRQKAAHSVGNYGATAASPAKPRVTLKPRSVEQRYPD